jgi:hypothetical protein
MNKLKEKSHHELVFKSHLIVFSISTFLNECCYFTQISSYYTAVRVKGESLNKACISGYKEGRTHQKSHLTVIRTWFPKPCHAASNPKFRYTWVVSNHIVHAKILAGLIAFYSCTCQRRVPAGRPIASLAKIVGTWRCWSGRFATPTMLIAI